MKPVKPSRQQASTPVIITFLILLFVGLAVVVSASPSSTVDIAEQDTIAQEKINAELQQPLHNFDDFFEWSTTSITSLYGRVHGGKQGDSQERWAYINSKCSIYEDTDGDGDKDQYYDKSCLQTEYSEYLKPSAFDYGSSKDNGGSWICPADGEKYYSYVCSIYGDMITHTSASKLSSAFKPAEEREKAEAIYNAIAKTKGDN